MKKILVFVQLLGFLGALSIFSLCSELLASPADVEIRHESVRLTRIGPERRFGVSPTGILYRPADRMPQTAVIVIHPENDRRNDWHCTALAQAGYAAFCMATRYVRENEHLIMEEVVLDLAEAVRYLKEDRGFRYVVLQGHSGGGSTVALYQNQAQKKPPNRIQHTPAGDPPDLNDYYLPQADGLIISAAHLGRGWAVARKLDPSVVDEDDPLSLDPSLDMFDPENGFRVPPEASRYSEEFIQRFKAAQAARMQRLIARAREMVAERKMYQKLLAAPDFNQRSPREQLKIRRGAIMQRYMTIYRDFSSLYYVDPNFDPDDRLLGTTRGNRPDLYNYYAYFHPRNISPEALLSAESTASNVYTPNLLPEVTVPLLAIIGSADPGSLVGETRTHYEAAGSKDKEFVVIEGADHSYLPAGPKAGKGDQRERTIQALSDWLSKRFPH